MKKTILAVLALFTVSLSNSATPNIPRPVANDLVVHEWGTFTTIAGRDGTALDWRPLNVKSDLPTFVYSVEKNDGFRGNFKETGKRDPARVRMETPVIYFYSGKEMDIDVAVRFPDGQITEWYPQAGLINGRYGPDKPKLMANGIHWGTVRLLPNEKPAYLREAAASHYYPARETDAVPIRVCNVDKTRVETENFLFYRGIGNFDLPLRARLDGTRILISDGTKKCLNDGSANLMIFENRGGRIGFRMVPDVTKDITAERPALDANIGTVLAQLEKSLISQGLYAKEARAMIATWRDSWFEEGLRIFYILPRKTTDAILPLSVEPTPRETVRVLVGRTELITPEMTQDVRARVARLRSDSPEIREMARQDLKKYGRFFEPILKELLQTETDAAMRTQLERLIALE